MTIVVDIDDDGVVHDGPRAARRLVLEGAVRAVPYPDVILVGVHHLGAAVALEVERRRSRGASLVGDRHRPLPGEVVLEDVDVVGGGDNNLGEPVTVNVS